MPRMTTVTVKGKTVSCFYDPVNRTVRPDLGGNFSPSHPNASDQLKGCRQEQKYR